LKDAAANSIFQRRYGWVKKLKIRLGKFCSLLALAFLARLVEKPDALVRTLHLPGFPLGISGHGLTALSPEDGAQTFRKIKNKILAAIGKFLWLLFEKLSEQFL